jgi:hypothetical protein
MEDVHTNVFAQNLFEEEKFDEARDIIYENAEAMAAGAAAVLAATQPGVAALLTALVPFVKAVTYSDVCYCLS